MSTVISNSALKAFERHLWYLTAEMVPLALYSSKVPAEHIYKTFLATSLLAAKPSRSCTVHKEMTDMAQVFGKPNFPCKITRKTTLADLVGPDSWYIFHILQLNLLSSPLMSQPGLPSAHPAYQEALINLEAINVVNDSAKRSVKLSTDFISLAIGVEHNQNVLHVVEADRKHQP